MMEVSYIDQTIVLDFNDTVVLSLEVGGSGVWKAFALTIHTTEVSINTATNSTSSSISPKDFIGNFSSVIIGRGFSGLFQGINVYDQPFEGFNLPESSIFLPQCYCQSLLTSSGLCSEDGKETER